MKDKINLLLTTMALFFISATGLSQTVECGFNQVKFIKASGKTIDMSGTMTLVYPDNLTMNYIEPQGEYFIIKGNEVNINKNGKKLKVDTDKNARMHTQTTTLLNCIKGNYEQAAVDNNTEIEIKDTATTKKVTLTAKKKAPRGYSRIILTYNKADNMLHEMVLEEFGGVVNTYTLSNIITK